MTLATRWEGLRLAEAQVRGDFLAPDPLAAARLLDGLRGRTAEDAARLASAAPLPVESRSTLVRLLQNSAPNGEAP